MSLDKAIKYGKEHRKPYTGSRRFDRTCHNHGSCSYCRDNRCVSSRRRAPVDERDRTAPLPCPCCGNLPRERFDIANGVFTLRCQECRSTAVATNPLDAVVYWNRLVLEG